MHASQVDQIIQEEQARAEAAVGDRGEPSQGRGQGASGAAAGRAEGSGGASEPGSEAASASATEGASARVSGGEALDSSRPSNDLGHPPPPDVGDGSDDDTLARQLRELAMNEPDPELRERYWEEYRKHKGID